MNCKVCTLSTLGYRRVKVYIKLISGERCSNCCGSAQGPQCVCSWPRAGPCVGHQRAVILCGMLAECKCTVWARTILLADISALRPKPHEHKSETCLRIDLYMQGCNHVLINTEAASFSSSSDTVSHL